MALEPSELEEEMTEAFLLRDARDGWDVSGDGCVMSTLSISVLFKPNFQIYSSHNTAILFHLYSYTS
jgi:hypothetical protein